MRIVIVVSSAKRLMRSTDVLHSKSSSIWIHANVIIGETYFLHLNILTFELEVKWKRLVSTFSVCGYDRALPEAESLRPASSLPSSGLYFSFLSSSPWHRSQEQPGFSCLRLDCSSLVDVVRPLSPNQFVLVHDSELCIDFKQLSTWRVLPNFIKSISEQNCLPLSRSLSNYFQMCVHTRPLCVPPLPISSCVSSLLHLL